jgi:hypothetical protein
MNRAEIVRLINSEIKWHREHRSLSGHPAYFERGFIAGLRQSRLLINKLAKISRGK